MILAHGANLAAGLAILALILVGLTGLPTLVGMAVSVARRSPEKRWQPLAIGAVVSACIAAVVAAAFEVHTLVICGIGMAGGAALGAAIGGIVRAVRKSR